jgi:hypothetical protein
MMFQRNGRKRYAQASSKVFRVHLQQVRRLHQPFKLGVVVAKLVELVVIHKI